MALEPQFYLSSVYICYCPWLPHESGAGGDWIEGVMDM